MNIGVFTKPNSKGQIVIPKEMRDELGIGTDITLNVSISGKGIYIVTVEEFIVSTETENSYLKLLEKTKGSWGDVDLVQVKKKKKFELVASEKRRQSW